MTTSLASKMIKYQEGLETEAKLMIKTFSFFFFSFQCLFFCAMIVPHWVKKLLNWPSSDFLLLLNPRKKEKKMWSSSIETWNKTKQNKTKEDWKNQYIKSTFFSKSIISFQNVFFKQKCDIKSQTWYEEYGVNIGLLSETAFYKIYYRSFIILFKKNFIQ